MSSADKNFRKGLKSRFVEDPETFHMIDEYVKDVSYYLDFKSESEINDETLTIIYNFFKQDKSSIEAAEFIKIKTKWTSDISNLLSPLQIVQTKNNFGLGNNGCMYDIYFNELKIAEYTDEGYIVDNGVYGEDTTVAFITEEAQKSFVEFCYENKLPELMLEYTWNWKKELSCITVDDMIQAVLCHAEER